MQCHSFMMQDRTVPQSALSCSLVFLGRIPLPKTNIFLLLFFPQGLLFSTNSALYLDQTGYLYKQQILQEA